MKKLYVIAGEMSGDAHACGLLKELKKLRPDLVIHGAGGPEIAGVSHGNTRDWVEAAAVMGVVEVLKHYSWFRAQFGEMLGEIRELQPDVLLLVDYPGYNLRFAKAVRKLRLPIRIIYYISPQVWAWNRRRVPVMGRLLDEMLCLFHFERSIFEEAGLKTTHVGHPIIDQVKQLPKDVVRDPHLIGLFPGSREREIAKLFPLMIATAKTLRASQPTLTFRVPAATPALRQEIEKMLKEAGASTWISLTHGGSHELMQKAQCAVIASGTATLEATVLGLPYCLVYKMAPSTYFLGKRLVKIKHIGIANILAQREVIPEFIQENATPQALATWIREILDDPEARQNLSVELKKVSDLLGGAGTHRRAAQRVNHWLEFPETD